MAFKLEDLKERGGDSRLRGNDDRNKIFGFMQYAAFAIAVDILRQFPLPQIATESAIKRPKLQ